MFTSDWQNYPAHFVCQKQMKILSKTHTLMHPKPCCHVCTGGYDIPTCLLLPAIAHEIMGTQYNIPVIDFYNTSMALFDGHITAAQSIAGTIDCMHFCRPGLGEVSCGTDCLNLNGIELSHSGVQLILTACASRVHFIENIVWAPNLA